MDGTEATAQLPSHQVQLAVTPPLRVPPLTFGQPQLLQLARQGLTIHVVLGSAGEDEAEDGNGGFHVP